MSAYRNNSAIPDAIFWLLIINGLVFAAQQLTPIPNWPYDRVTTLFGLWPVGGMASLFAPWQVLTYGFLHGDPMHLLFNMLMLWMFGRELASLMGTGRFLVYFLTCVIGAALVQLVVAEIDGSVYPTIGASGGVYGILLAFGMTFPNRTVLLVFPPIPMRAKYMVILFGAMELAIGFSGYAPTIANFAHLGGMLFGFALLKFWQRPRRR